MGCTHIPTNLSKAKSGTKSLKKQDFWFKIGTFYKISQNYQVDRHNSAQKYC